MSADPIRLKFKMTDAGIEIIDPIERCRYQLETTLKSTLAPVEEDQIGYPVDSAVKFTTDSIQIPDQNDRYLLDPEGSMLDILSLRNQSYYPERKYVLDLSRDMKVYLLVESSIRICPCEEQCCIKFGDCEEIILGARSYHARPAGVVKTTSDPVDLMQAVSTFGSTLKTTAPERSFPTLRGHPPALELDDELSVPEEFQVPNPGISIKIPPTHSHIFASTPLAYYLGAKIIPGSIPMIVTENGYEHRFNDKKIFEFEVRKVFNQIFSLDCIVRTEGGWPGPLHERKIAEPVLDFDISSAYRKPIKERIELYLKTPYSSIKSRINNFQSETYIEPNKYNIGFLPFLSYDLTAIFTKCDENSQITTQENGAKTADKQEIQVPTATQYWKFTEGSKIGSTVPLLSFYNKIGQSPKTDPIDIRVVCNDKKMQEELINVYSSYGKQGEVPSNVTLHHDLEKETLRRVLKQDSDFIHYIGHIDADGFRCADGNLCASSLNTAGAKALFLIACQSFKQGLHLIKAGSVGGIVTLGNVPNKEAVNVGNNVSQFLDRGHPLYVAIEGARNESDSGHLYHLIGDGATIVSKSEEEVSKFCAINREKSGFSLEFNLFRSVTRSGGGLSCPNPQLFDHYHLIPGQILKKDVSKPQLVQLLEEETMPVLLDGEVRWSDEIRISEL